MISSSFVAFSQESLQLIGQAALHELATKALEAVAAMDDQACTAAEARFQPTTAAAAGAALSERDVEDGDAAVLDRADSSLLEGFEGLTVETEEEDEEAQSGGAAGGFAGGLWGWRPGGLNPKP